jgi:hypothetical protein
MFVGLGVAPADPSTGRIEAPRSAHAVKTTDESAMSSTEPLLIDFLP